MDANKLLVPTAPAYGEGEDDDIIVSGFDPNVGVASGIIQSFYDAPGIVERQGDGTYLVEPGSVFREELREINLGGGIEYDYNGVFAVRGGYFFEHYTKGNRQFITLGAGIKYTVLDIDLSYLIATTQQNPLANTLRFSLRLAFDDMVGGADDDPANLLIGACPSGPSHRLRLRCPPAGGRGRILARGHPHSLRHRRSRPQRCRRSAPCDL